MLVLVRMKSTDYEALTNAGFTMSRVRSLAAAPPNAELLAEAVCDVCGADLSTVRSQPGSRRMALVRARMLFVGISREILGHSYPELASLLRMGSHTTAISANQRWLAMADGDEFALGMTKAGARRAVFNKLGIESETL